MPSSDPSVRTTPGIWALASGRTWMFATRTGVVRRRLTADYGASVGSDDVDGVVGVAVAI